MPQSYRVGDTEYQFPDKYSDQQVQSILTKQGVIKPKPNKKTGGGKNDSFIGGVMDVVGPAAKQFVKLTPPGMMARSGQDLIRGEIPGKSTLQDLGQAAEGLNESMVKRPWEYARRTGEAMVKGDVMGAVRNAPGMVPGIGPAVEDVTDTAASGQYKRAAGQGVALIGMSAAPGHMGGEAEAATEAAVKKPGAVGRVIGRLPKAHPAVKIIAGLAPAGGTLIELYDGLVKHYGSYEKVPIAARDQLAYDLFSEKNGVPVEKMTGQQKHQAIGESRNEIAKYVKAKAPPNKLQPPSNSVSAHYQAPKVESPPPSGKSVSAHYSPSPKAEAPLPEAPRSSVSAGGKVGPATPPAESTSAPRSVGTGGKPAVATLSEADLHIADVLANQAVKTQGVTAEALGEIARNPKALEHFWKTVAQKQGIPGQSPDIIAEATRRAIAALSKPR